MPHPPQSVTSDLPRAPGVCEDQPSKASCPGRWGIDERAGNPEALVNVGGSVSTSSLRPKQVLAPLLLFGLFSWACGERSSAEPDREIASSTQPEDSQPVGDSVVSSPTGAEPTAVSEAVGEWETFEPIFSTDGGERRAVVPPSVEIVAIAGYPGGYLATGRFDGRPTIWRSTDAAVFDIVHHELPPAEVDCCWRFARLKSIAVFEDTLLVAGNGTSRDLTAQPSEIERGFLLRSDDDGKTWSDVESDLFSAPYQRIDNLVNTGSSLIVDLVNDECCGGPAWQPIRTTDFVNWDPIVLPDAPANVWGTFYTDGQDSVWVVARGQGDERLVWSSVDGGATWSRAPDQPNSADPVVSSDFLITTGGATEADDDRLIRHGPAVLTSGKWEERPIDLGQFGDVPPNVIDSILDPASGRAWVLLGRSIRGDDQYCFTDAERCQQNEFVLTSVLGDSWWDVAGVDLPPLRYQLFLTPEGQPAYMWRSGTSDAGRNEPPLITRWTGSGPPELVDPDGYELPDDSVPILGWQDAFPVGSQFRYIWGIGGCGPSLWFEETAWLPEKEPDYSSWPHQIREQTHGPTISVYGVAHRLEQDLIEFSIDGLGVVARFVPAPDEYEFPRCG